MTVVERTPFVISDLYDLDWLEDPRMSPDGQTVAYVHVRVDRLQNCYRRAIYLVPVRHGQPRRFTAGQREDHTPRWSPDGRRLAFVSTRDDERGQIYVIRVDGGEAAQVTFMPRGAREPAWSPDGTRIAFLAACDEDERMWEDRADTDIAPVAPADAWEERRMREAEEHAEAQRHDPRVITRLPYRTGTDYFDNRRHHIYIVAVPTADLERADCPQPRRITDGDIHHSAPVWMPDGQVLLTTATRDPEADALLGYYDVLRVPATGGKPEILTRSGYSYFDPQPAPDGSMIAFRRLPEERLLAGGYRVALIPVAGGEPQSLTAHTDLSVELFRWHPNSQGVYFSAGWNGTTGVYHADTEPDSTRRQVNLLVDADRMVSAFDVGGAGTVAFVAGTPDMPCNLFVRHPSGEEVQLTQLNAALLSARRVVPFAEIQYTAPDGERVQGWVAYPPDFDSSQQYPLVVHIHGGPPIMWGPGYRSMWHEWQVCAARGYIVFFCNPRGSDGYGEQWRGSIRDHWGEADAPDILAGIDFLVAQGHVDPARIAVTGGSYGGFMTTWLIGHTDRFACAVAARGVFSLISQYGTSDAHELIESEFSGYPWELQEELWYHSPLAHAHKITTPLLLLHGELDYRTPISEAEQLFAFLRRQKKTVELVRYPREGHELTRTGEPRHREDHLTRTLEWFDRYCQP
ncbi:MAG: prolyl oligopeptidase family serine peptidase [Chloroflexaceae bacterium]